MLYTSGSVTVHTLAATEYLNITDVIIYLESGGDFLLAANSDAAGRRIAVGNAAVNGGIAKTLSTPYTCPQGVMPKFSGASSNRNVCLIEGYITKV